MSYPKFTSTSSAQPALAPAGGDSVVHLLHLELAEAHREIHRLHEAQMHQQHTLEQVQQQLLCYARDLKNNYSRERALVDGEHRALMAERQMMADLESSYVDTLMRLVHASAFRDLETGAHIQRIGLYSSLLALEYGMSIDVAERLLKAAPMHDVGKLGVPDSVLNKPGPLSPAEWELMKRHCELGAQLLSGSPSLLLQTAERIAWSHHERFDGTGYPRRLRGTDIPIEARIVSIADVYDALRSPRPYKPALPHSEASRILLQGDRRTRPEHFDPELLNVFRQCGDRFDAIYEQYSDTQGPLLDDSTYQGGW